MNLRLIVFSCALLSAWSTFGAPPARSFDDGSRPPSAVGEAAFEKARWVFDNVASTRYEHCRVRAGQQVLSTSGGRLKADTDCSGFISYVIDTIAPRQYKAIRDRQPGRSYPQARTFAEFFAGLSLRSPERGWVRVASVKDLRRADIIAWAKERPADARPRRGNSGHVMMVIDPPGGIEVADVDGSPVRFVSVRVLDSSSVRHFEPERLPPLAGQTLRDGLGEGVVRLILDDDDRAVGYWEGTYWGEGHKEIRKPSYSKAIHFGRLVPYGD